jgi:enolase-phosphatase E1
VSFVRDVLFAYSRQRLSGFIAASRGDAVIEDLLRHATAIAGGTDAVAALTAWHDRDVKAPPLKKLQGLIWESGYRSGAFRSPIFPDALAALTRWHADGLSLAIYSSGSVQAQLLFFEFSAAGDIRPMFSAHYDTEIGPKVEAKSYELIAEKIGTQAGHIVFLSDSTKELEAASVAGLQTVHVVKDDTPSDPAFAEIRDFGEIEIAPPSRR